MIEKRGIILGLFGLIILSVILVNVNVVSAASISENLGAGLSAVADFIVDPLVDFTEQTVAFTKTLFFILVFLIVISILSYIPLFEKKKGISFGVSIIISILSVFFIPTDLILPLLNPYSAMGIAFISIIPFILVFLFTQHMLRNTFLKKVVWFIFAVGLLLMTIYTALLQQSDPSQYGNPLFGWIYGIASVLALLMVFANKWIDKNIFSGKMEAGMDKAEKDYSKRKALDKFKVREAEDTFAP